MDTMGSEVRVLPETLTRSISKSEISKHRGSSPSRDVFYLSIKKRKIIINRRIIAVMARIILFRFSLAFLSPAF